MSQNRSIAFLGAGHMGGAIASRLLQEGSRQVIIFDPDESKCAAFAKKGAVIASSAISACKSAEYILLAVKPQIADKVLAGLCEVNFTGKVLITIAAGVSSDFIEKAVGKPLAIIRVMPNTAAELGLGSTAYSVNARVSADDEAEIAEMLASLGAAYKIDESQMNAVICVNGSSPAYFYYFMEAMFDSARAQGITCSDHELMHMIAMTLKGTADMTLTAIKEGKSFSDRIREVAVPGGTTEQAMNVLRAEKVNESIHRAMLACTKRTEELSAALEVRE